MHSALTRLLQQHLGSADLKQLEKTPGLADFVRAVEATFCDEAEGVESLGGLLTEETQKLSDALSEQKAREALLQKEKTEQAELIRRLEEAHNQLLQSEKMASIGSLAAGVAHEINNPIGFVGSNLNSLKDYIKDLVGVVDAYDQAGLDHEQLDQARLVAKQADLEFLREDVLILIDECREGIDRVRRIVQDLRDFSHVDHGEWVIGDLHKGLDSTLNIVNNEIKYKAEVIREYGTIPEIACIGSQLNQVFMNLLVNAAHAIEVRGQIWVRTWAEGGWVCVEIQDTGCGIRSDMLKRIFDPFYTTKPVGVGTGLGLSLSYGIVKKHGGRIEVESELGNGSVFRVWLPAKLEIPESADEKAGARSQVQAAEKV